MAFPKQGVIKGLVANHTGRAPMPVKLTTKPPSGKANYSIPRTRPRGR